MHCVVVAVDKKRERMWCGIFQRGGETEREREMERGACGCLKV